MAAVALKQARAGQPLPQASLCPASLRAHPSCDPSGVFTSVRGHLGRVHMQASADSSQDSLPVSRPLRGWSRGCPGLSRVDPGASLSQSPTRPWGRWGNGEHVWFFCEGSLC